MKYCFIDTESTGLPDYAARSSDESQPRTIQIAMIVTEDSKAKTSFSTLIKPDGWTVPEHITQITGITTERCEAEGMPIAEAYKLFENIAADGVTFVAHSKNHDRKILKIEAVRLGHEEIPENEWLCTMHASTKECQIPKANGHKGFKFPKLEEAYEILTGEKLEGAHDAYVDALAVMAIFFELQRRGAV